ncbi:MAG: ubiquitin-conjugating enzyme E2 [Pirellulaceae bacterium]
MKKSCVPFFNLDTGDKMVTAEQRPERLAAELESMRALRKSSNILDFEFRSEPPDRYTVIFRGRGISRDRSSRSDIKYEDLHRIDIRLPFSYPQQPPDIRWLTPIFHPNVSFSGFIRLSDLGMPWEPDLGLDVICERLWDVVRLAFMNAEQASNHAAKNWFEDQSMLPLPVDPRPLRDRNAPAGANVIRYERRGERRTAVPATSSADGILFIGEDTPTPQLPVRIVPPVRRRPPNDDDILYIGDD